ncbi:MAG: toll/interleukin-1 receptor domain-containing protein [Sphingomicrobium sp.]
MASLFLSYAREDAKKAGCLARSLEAVGHGVWWDRQIEGGDRFGAAIATALNAADAIVVLWSSNSVDSAWVQDEAAAARDTKRLVPVLVEAVDPPLGFRQYQSIDLTRWNGRKAPVEMPRILSAIARLTGSSHAASAEHKLMAAKRAPGRRSVLIGVATVAILTASAFALSWYAGSGASAAPSVTVIASNKASRQSAELAHSVALDLSRFQSGPLSGLSISEAGTQQSGNGDYQVEISVIPSGANVHADLALVDPHTGGVMWTSGVDAVSQQLVDLRQQASARVGAVLACAVHTPAMRPRPSNEVLGLYLAGCARLSDVPPDANDQTALSIFRRITQKEPRLAEGWAGLALIESGAWGAASDTELARMIEKAKTDLRRARDLNPTVDMGYAAEGRLIPPWDRKWWSGGLNAYDRGLQLNPDSALLYRERSQALLYVGRMNEAVDSAQRAAELDPLSATVRDAYISALAYAGHVEAAKRELDQAERIWPGSAVIENMRYRFDLRYGDAANALRLMKERGDLIGVANDPSFQAFLNARISPTAANKEAAVATFADAYRHNPNHIFGLLQTLGTFGRVNEAYDLVKPDSTLIYLRFASDLLWRPDTRSIRADPRFIGLANRLGLVQLWRQTGVWPDFCQDPGLRYDCRKEAAKYPPLPANQAFSPPPQAPA